MTYITYSIRGDGLLPYYVLFRLKKESSFLNGHKPTTEIVVRDHLTLTPNNPQGHENERNYQP